jgi:hypothetical protein
MRKLVFVTILIVMPVIFVTSHSNYVNKLNAFNDQGVLRLEKEIKNIEGLSLYYEGVSLQQIEDSDLASRGEYFYKLVGNGTSSFSDLDEDKKNRALITIFHLINKELTMDSTVSCGKNKFCKLTKLEIVDTASNNKYEKEFWRTNSEN